MTRHEHSFRAYGRIKKIRTATGTRSKRHRPRESWTLKEGAYPAIIDSDLWEHVQLKRAAAAIRFLRRLPAAGLPPIVTSKPRRAAVA